MAQDLDISTIRRQHALGYGQCHVDDLIAEVERLRNEIADAREACPSIRMQDHFDASLLELVNLEVSRGFNRDAEIARMRVRDEHADAAIEARNKRLSEISVESDRLRAALVGLVGVDGREELEAMEGVMRLMPAPAADKAATIDAIHALLATCEQPPAGDAVAAAFD